MSTPIQSLGIDGLTPTQKLDLIERLWDSLPDQVNVDEVPQWHLELIRKRRAHAIANPGIGEPWRDAIAEIEKTI